MGTVLTEIEFNSKFIKSLPAVIIAEGYELGGLALVAMSLDGEVITKLSVWVEGVTPNLQFGWFVCKSYSENEGVEEWLVESGLCDYVHDAPPVPVGFVSARVLKLNDGLMAMLSGPVYVEMPDVEDPDDRG